MDNKQLYEKITCALTHDIGVCENCKKCEGKNAGEIRMNLIKELAKTLQQELPWKENENE